MENSQSHPHSPADTGIEAEDGGLDLFRPSLASNSVARLAANVVALAFGTTSAILTARWLGPANKGTLSSLLFATVLLTYACSLGLGDASIILIGKRMATLERAVSSALGIVFLTVPAGICAIFAIGWAADWSAIVGAVILAAIMLPISTCAYVLTAIINSQERILFTSFVSTLSSAVGAVGVIVFVVVLPLDVAGGVLAGLLASAISLVLLTSRLRRLAVRLRPKPSLEFLRKASRYGVVLESSNVLIAMSQRIDLLVVYALAGEAAAGIYSVALVLGQLVMYGPFALSVASFPRLANADPSDVPQLTATISRVGLAAAGLGAVALMLIIPLATVPLFGNSFKDATAPALILVGGGVLWSAQWLLARSAAARGRTRILLLSFLASTVTMLILDFALIPAFDLIGAALASAFGSALGLGLCLFLTRRDVDRPWKMTSLLPRTDDVRLVMSSPQEFWRTIKRVRP